MIGIDGHPLGETFGVTTMNQHLTGQGNMAVVQAFAQLGGAWDTADDKHPELQVDLKIGTITAVAPISRSENNCGALPEESATGSK